MPNQTVKVSRKFIKLLRETGTARYLQLVTKPLGVSVRVGDGRVEIEGEDAAAVKRVADEIRQVNKASQEWEK